MEVRPHGTLEGKGEPHLSSSMSEDAVDQMLILASRLREANGGTLDEAAIQAVAEATGAPTEYVRLAVKIRTEKENRNAVSQIRSQFLTLDSETRRVVFSGTMATFCALLFAVEWRLGEAVSRYGVLSMMGLLALTMGIYNVATSRDSRGAIVSGAVMGGGFYGMFALFSLILQSPVQLYPVAILACATGGAIAGAFLHFFVSKYRSQLGLKDPVKERQLLLQQLVELQEKLKEGAQSVTFLSVDIVGSTKMKELADPLAVEFTFSEYHDFVARITRKHSGRVHSTAGDGVTCAFQHPQQAWQAAKAIQTGLIELNTFRNKIGKPIVLRCGIHTGEVNAPDSADITTVNFSHVIDISAHAQKAAPPGGIAVTEAASTFLPGGWAAIGTERAQIDGVNIAIWRSRIAESPLISTTVAPPVPSGSPN